MHVLCMHPAHSLEGYSALLVPYIGVTETRTGYVPLGLVDLGSRSLGIFLVVFFVVVSRREVWGGVGARGGGAAFVDASERVCDLSSTR